MDEYELNKLLTRINELEAELKTAKKYGLVWDKELNKEKIVLDCQKNIPVLEQVPLKHILNNSNNNNVLIEGDNFHILTCLNYVFQNRVNLIYIDPPYNTGNKDFIYNDKFIDEEDGYRHSKWLSFMEKRLVLAKKLLSEDGIILISIDDNEQANLKLLCDKIFGERNFVSNIIWYKNNSKGNVKQISNVTEYVLCYAKSIYSLPNFEIKKSNAAKMCEAAKEFFESTNHNVEKTNILFRKWMKENEIESGEKKYNKVDENGRLYTDKPLTAPGSKLFYDIIHPITNKPCKVASRGWAYKYESFLELKESGHILFGKDETTCPYLKYYLDENLTQTPTSHVQVTANNAIDLQTLGFTKEDFSYPKPLSLIKQLLYFYPRKDAVVMDFFAGSGTTGQAVLEMNEEDGGSRKFILCTNNENNICENVTYPRIKCVIEGKKKDGTKASVEKNANLFYFKTDFVLDGNNTDQTKYNLVDKVDSLLCISENIFNEVSKNNFYSHYKCGNKNLYIYHEFYNEQQVSILKADIKKCGGQKIVYMFSEDDNLENIFTDLNDVIVKPIPSKIYEIYKEISEMIKRGE